MRTCLVFLSAGSLRLLADVGDPQIRTDHPFYPGELACSTFERLFATQAEQYRRATGIAPVTEEDKALAAWFWRNTHYWHGEEGAEDLWGGGFTKGSDLRTREYWTGSFAHGFGLCGTTHSQWTAEMEQLLGHGRARGVGASGHNAFEVFLTGGSYGNGKWALLDHDLSTVIFGPDGKRILSMAEISRDVKRWTNRDFLPEKQRGWLVCGLHPGDGASYAKYTIAEYLPGYAAVPPMVHLRRGETLRRYLEPGLEDGKTFVFWGRNYNTGGIPGPERSITWVNQPEKMRGSREGAGYHLGQARYANAVYVYQPNFKTDDYREGVIEENLDRVIFEFYTPYIIGATPPNATEWGIYDSGGRNGLVVGGTAECSVAISVDQGRTWRNCGTLRNGLDLTDYVKGRRQYWIRFGAGAARLAGSGLTMTTVCQAAIGVLPRLKENGSSVSFQASGGAVISAGPNLEQARTHLVSGGFDSPALTLELATPRQQPVTALYAAAHVASGNPPDPDVNYQIEYTIDGGKTWNSLLKDGRIRRQGEDPGDFWSQSLCHGSVAIEAPSVTKVQVRFKNSGGKKYLRAEAQLVYRTPSQDGTRVTFDWADGAGSHRESRVFAAHERPASEWQLKTGTSVRTRWVQFEPMLN